MPSPNNLKIYDLFEKMTTLFEKTTDKEDVSIFQFINSNRRLLDEAEKEGLHPKIDKLIK